jgi:hypothetical protein
MGKRDNDKKTTRRLQLRREVILVLADDCLARVAGGRSGTCTDQCSPCMPSQ